MSNFLRPLIAQGLAKLSVLNLPSRQAAVDLVAVADVWMESLLRYRKDWRADLDAQRIEQAFCYLIDHAEQWPNPRDLIRAMAPRSQPIQKQIPTPPVSPEKIEANRRRLADILKKLGNKMEIPR